MAPITPYSPDLAGRDPLVVMPHTVAAIDRLTRSWTVREFERRSAPGKWTAGQILMHLVQTEIALGSRARMALSTPHYEAQSFDQDAWMAKEPVPAGREAVDALVAMSRLNVALFSSLSVADRHISFSHPEYGALTVDWLIHQMAGHQVHHLTQLENLS
jgi:hypothetical protein